MTDPGPALDPHDKLERLPQTPLIGVLFADPAGNFITGHHRHITPRHVCRPFVIPVGEPTPYGRNHSAFHRFTPGVFLACRSTMPSISALLQWTTQCRACSSPLESRHHVVLHVRITERWCPRCETCDVWWGGSHASMMAPTRAVTPAAGAHSPVYTR